MKSSTGEVSWEFPAASGGGEEEMDLSTTPPPLPVTPPPPQISVPSPPSPPDISTPVVTPTSGIFQNNLYYSFLKILYLVT